MKPDALIYVAGHRGLAGSAIVRALLRKGYTNLLTQSSAELDLTRQGDVERFFADRRPEFVFLAAAKVGGILANDSYPADFIRVNLQIQTNVIDAAYHHGVRKLCFLGSSCIYPKLADQPDCVFPDAPNQAAPDWVCDVPVEGIELSAVGYSQKSSVGNSFMKQMATTDARVQLAAIFKTRIQNMIKQYAEVTGAADSETVDRVNTSVTKAITSETLIGSRIYKTRTSPKGGIYVLIGLDSAHVQQVAEDSIKTSMNNEKALWQQFKAQKAQDELAAEISKIK